MQDKWKAVPWQIGVVVVMLAYEGLTNNLPMIPRYPIAAFWLAGKILLIVGLLKGWKWMLFVFVAIAALHAVAFLGAPRIAFLNLAMAGLAISARRYFLAPPPPAADADGR
ncbi:MAG: hypothetical protein ABFD69_02225 [Candidatus Sumerlaeia bacterium]